MNRFENITRPLKWFLASLLVALAAGCGGGGGGDPVLGVSLPPLTAATYADLIRPRVALTVPATTTPGPTLVAPANAAITAAFTEAMAPATMIAANFTIVSAGPGAAGALAATSVTYDAPSKTVTFKHAGLTVGDTYTATITTAATDVAGNALAGNADPVITNASNYVWTFTASANDAAAPTITLTAPIDGAVGVNIDSSVSATFSEAMDPTTLCGTASLTVPCPVASFTVVNTTLGGTNVAGAVTYNPVTKIMTFKPTAALPVSSLFTATVTVAAKDLAGIALAAGAVPNPWTFTTGLVASAGGASLGTASTFGIMATSAITSTGNSIINGDVSLEPGTSMTGFPPGIVTGAIHINDTVSHQARADLLAAYNTLKGLPPGAGANALGAGADPGALFPGGVPPGTYTSGSTIIAATAMTLDAGGDADAVWVFQIGSSLTTGANISLANGAQAKNVYWVPTQDATIGVGSTFYGNIVSGRDVTAVTGATINGRILAGAITAGTVALQAAVVNVPLP